MRLNLKADIEAEKSVGDVMDQLRAEDGRINQLLRKSWWLRHMGYCYRINMAKQEAIIGRWTPPFFKYIPVRLKVEAMASESVMRIRVYPSLVTNYVVFICAGTVVGVFVFFVFGVLLVPFLAFLFLQIKSALYEKERGFEILESVAQRIANGE